MPDEMQIHFDQPITALLNDRQTSLRVQPQRLASKILLYTDDFDIAAEPLYVKGLGLMIEQIKQHPSNLVDFQLEPMINRHEGAGAPHLLTDALLADYDEVWFFGFLRVNGPAGALTPYPGGPNNELTLAEQAALRGWMDERGGVGGGVLMAGDHSEAVEGIGPVGLGAAIGEFVPRAGQLRVWRGGPEESRKKNINSCNIYAGGLQSDSAPQSLTLPTFDGNWQCDSTGLPHPIFFRREGLHLNFIRVYPDHGHEGLVTLPEVFGADWRDSNRMKPFFIATSNNYGGYVKNPFPVLAAYPGDVVELGRIIADSSWRHFMNENLKGFNGVPEVLDQIGQFYSNLAFWLLPTRKRQAILLELILWLLEQFSIREQIGGDTEQLGTVAVSLLSTHVQPCELYDLLQLVVHDKWRKQLAGIGFPLSSNLSAYPSRELIIGALLQEYYQLLSTATTRDLTTEKLSMTFRELNQRGMIRAATLHDNLLHAISTEWKTDASPLG
jgi:hypothetical protein